MAIGDIDTGVPVPSVITTSLVVVSVIFPVLSFIAIAIRHLSARKARRAFHADDAWIVISFLPTLALSAMVWGIAGLSGINYYDINPAKGTQYSLMLVFLASCIIQLPLAAVKISILLFYKTIFATRRFRIAVWIAIALVSVWGIVFFVFVLTQVDPISASWTGGRLRYDSAALGLAQVGSSIALDFVVLCFPLPVISRLQMAYQRKIAVALIFWLGAFCCIAAIIRLVYLEKSIRGVLGAEQNIFLQSRQFVFLIIEPNCSIIAACLPTYGPLFAGGRGLSSIVNSVRSVFSLRSTTSSRNRYANASHDGHQAPNKSDTDSQIELTTQGWGMQDVRVVGGQYDRDSPRMPPHGDRTISVTHGVTIVPQSRS